MAWDKSLPANSTKIRNAPPPITNNWDAIESADATFKPVALNLDNRTPLGVTNDPAAIADAVLAYSKEDASGDPQLYAIDPSSVITQLSGTSFSAIVNGSLTIAGGLIIKWGKTSGTSGVKTFPVAFPTSALNVQVTIIDNNARYGSIKTITRTGFTFTPDSPASNIYYIAIGK